MWWNEVFLHSLLSHSTGLQRHLRLNWFGPPFTPLHLSTLRSHQSPRNLKDLSAALWSCLSCCTGNAVLSAERNPDLVSQLYSQYYTLTNSVSLKGVSLKVRRQSCEKYWRQQAASLCSFAVVKVKCHEKSSWLHSKVATTSLRCQVHRPSVSEARQGLAALVHLSFKLQWYLRIWKDPVQF